MTGAEILRAPLGKLYDAHGVPVDRWLDVRWRPSALMQLMVGVTSAGGPPRVGKETPGVHLTTPQTETTTHDFWSNSRDFRRDDVALHARRRRASATPSSVWRGLARQVLRKLIAQERARAEVAA